MLKVGAEVDDLSNINKHLPKRILENSSVRYVVRK